MDRAFTSAIWKEPVAGPIWVGTLGIRGDAVGNPRVHGGPDQAVLMYAASHYAAWRAEWGGDIGLGAFGENLSVDGLTEDTTCLGDVYDIGGARLEVTKPREPCSTEVGQEVSLVSRLYPEWPMREVARTMIERHSDPSRAARLARCPALAANWKKRLSGLL
jgi:MOSC domain-containing protein YiiM